MTFSLKNLLKRAIPLKYRLLRYAMSEKLKYYPQRLVNLGDRVQCPFCGWTFARFLPSRMGSRPFAGDSPRGDDCTVNTLCPRCHSHGRERLLYLYLTHKTDLFSHSDRYLLHVAPEPCLERVLRRFIGPRCLTTDLDQPGVGVRMDITAIPNPASSFDVILCCHVLEHVIDDRAAMAEIYRVLRPDGFAVLQVPISLELAKTYEDPTIVSPEARLRAFGQHDHVRLYGIDYTERLRSVGFFVRTYSSTGEFGQDAVERYGLISEERIFVCSKTPEPTSASRSASEGRGMAA